MQEYCCCFGRSYCHHVGPHWYCSRHRGLWPGAPEFIENSDEPVVPIAPRQRRLEPRQPYPPIPSEQNYLGLIREIERLRQDRDEAWDLTSTIEQLEDAVLRLEVASTARVRMVRLEEAIDAALHELGVPDEHYPAPVANAVILLESALQPPIDESEKTA